MVQRKQQKISKVWSTPSFFLLKENIVKRKNVLSLKLLEIQPHKNCQMFCKSRAFRMCCISKIITDRTFFAIDS